jgi:hypothetical protein
MEFIDCIINSTQQERLSNDAMPLGQLPSFPLAAQQKKAGFDLQAGGLTCSLR